MAPDPLLPLLFSIRILIPIFNFLYSSIWMLRKYIWVWVCLCLLFKHRILFFQNCNFLIVRYVYIFANMSVQMSNFRNMEQFIVKKLLKLYFSCNNNQSLVTRITISIFDVNVLDGVLHEIKIRIMGRKRNFGFFCIFTVAFHDK